MDDILIINIINNLRKIDELFSWIVIMKWKQRQ